MESITPFPVDDESTREYIRRKLPEWHTRLQKLERKCDTMHATLDRIEGKLDDFNVALKGSDDGKTRGLFTRTTILEGFRGAVIKVAVILLGMILTAVGGLIATLL